MLLIVIVHSSLHLSISLQTSLRLKTPSSRNTGLSSGISRTPTTTTALLTDRSSLFPLVRTVLDLENVTQVHPTGLVGPNDPNDKVKFLAAEALCGVGGLILDNEGQRFVDELQHRDFVTGKMWENGKVRFPV